jgi:hypothetical protein
MKHVQRLLRVLSFGTVGLAAIGSLTAEQTPAWPHIHDFHRSFDFSDQASMFLDFPIVDVSGATVYRMQCTNPFAMNATDSGFDWSGDFECRVFLPQARFMPDVQLLALTTSSTQSDWESRGRFFWNQLTPDCIGVPEWGGTRTYRFRHMRITIQISEPQIVPPKSFTDNKEFWTSLRGFHLDIAGHFDSAASPAVAGPAHTGQPPPLYPDVNNGPLQCGQRSKVRSQGLEVTGTSVHDSCLARVKNSVYAVAGPSPAAPSAPTVVPSSSFQAPILR